MRFLKRFWQKQPGATSVPRKKRDLYLVSGLGLFLLGLICSFYLTFPDAVLKQRLVHEIETRLPLKVTLAEAGLRPLFTLAGKQLTVGLPDQAGNLFQADTFHVDPKWISTFTGDPGVEGGLSAATGELSFSWLRSGPLELSSLNLPFDIPLATSPATRFAGILAAGQVTTVVPLQKSTASHIDITLAQVAVQGLGALVANAAGLQLGQVSLLMKGQGTSFSIARLETSGGELLVSGEGTLMLVTAKPQDSRINLNLSVRVSKQADPTFASLLSLAGTELPDGGRKLRLTGTLAKPVIR